MTQGFIRYLDSVEYTSSKFSSLVIFVNHLKDIFEHYLDALATIKKLETEIIVLKGEK